jgi:NAD(P)-dependent dehydrogenase (short-subunit alcohol dehydrogenase family)
MSTMADPQLRREGMPGLKGKHVLVTGGSSGIGQAIAVRFAEHGAHVAINYLTTPDEAAGTEAQVQACVARVQQQGVRDVLVQGDVSDEQDVVRMVGEAQERLGGLDIIINNAGIQISRPSEELGITIAADLADLIPFERLEEFFNENLASEPDLAVAAASQHR